MTPKARIVSFDCFYTKDLRKKRKRWLDGLLRLNLDSSKLTLVDLETSRTMASSVRISASLKERLISGEVDELMEKKHFERYLVSDIKRKNASTAVTSTTTTLTQQIPSRKRSFRPVTSRVQKKPRPFRKPRIVAPSHNDQEENRPPQQSSSSSWNTFKTTSTSQRVMKKPRENRPPQQSSWSNFETTKEAPSSSTSSWSNYETSATTKTPIQKSNRSSALLALLTDDAPPPARSQDEVNSSTQDTFDGDDDLLLLGSTSPPPPPPPPPKPQNKIIHKTHKKMIRHTPTTPATPHLSFFCPVTTTTSTTQNKSKTHSFNSLFSYAVTFLQLISEEMQFSLQKSMQSLELSKMSSAQDLFKKTRARNTVVMSRGVKVVKWKHRKKQQEEQEQKKPKYYLTVPSTQVPRKRKYDPLKRGDLWCLVSRRNLNNVSYCSVCRTSHICANEYVTQQIWHSFSSNTDKENRTRLEIMPIFKDSDMPKCRQGKYKNTCDIGVALRGPNMSTDLLQVSILRSLCQMNMTPILREFVTNKISQNCNSHPFQTITPSLAMDVACKTALKFNLNLEQSSVLKGLATRWFGSSTDQRFELVHGCFGSGKSTLLIACLYMIRDIGVRSRRKIRVLFAAGTNVAVDRVLLGLLELQQEEEYGSMVQFHRVGSVRRNLLSFTLSHHKQTHIYRHARSQNHFSSIWLQTRKC